MTSSSCCDVSSHRGELAKSWIPQGRRSLKTKAQDYENKDVIIMSVVSVVVNTKLVHGEAGLALLA